MNDEDNFMAEKGIQRDSVNNNLCSVKNCGKEIPDGTGLKIEGKSYCATCGAIIIKESMGLQRNSLLY